MGGGEALSLGRTKRVRGYEIKQLPLGAFLAAAARLEEFPSEVMREVIGAATVEDAVGMFSTIDTDTLLSVIGKAVRVVPNAVISLVSDLSGIGEDELTNSPEIGLLGFVEIIEAVIEVNESGKVLAAVRRAAKTVTGAKMAAGVKSAAGLRRS